MRLQKAFKYCPRCASSFKDQHFKLACTNCGLDFYINPTPCTSVILVNDKGEFLLAERAVDPAKGLWDTPGGFVQENETLEEGAKREIKEELGIDVENLHYIGSFPSSYDFQGVDYPILAAVFVCPLPRNSKVKVDDDVASYKFFSPDHLPEENFGFPSMKKDFEAAKKFLKENRL
jgi:NAD+ diphosphatase